MSRPLLTRVRISARTALITSPSEGLASIRMKSAILGATLSKLSGIAQAPLTVTAPFTAKILERRIEARKQLAGPRRLDHRHGAVDRFLSEARIEGEREVKPFA